MKTLVAEKMVEIRRIGAALRSDRRGPQLAVIGGCMFLYTGDQMIFPVLLPELRAAYGFGLTAAGLLLTILWVVKALCQLPAGVLADRLGEETVLVVSVLFGAGALVLVVTARFVLVLFAATGVFGVGLALHSIARYTALVGIYPNQVGVATGVALATEDAGQSLVPPVAGLIAVLTTWYYGFGFTIPLFVLMAVVIWLYVPPKTSQSASSTTVISLETVRDVLAALDNRSVGLGTAILTVYFSI